MITMTCSLMIYVVQLQSLLKQRAIELCLIWSLIIFWELFYCPLFKDMLIPFTSVDVLPLWVKCRKRTSITFFYPSETFFLHTLRPIKRLFSSSLSAIRVVSSACLRLLIFSVNLDSSLCFFQPSVSHDVLCI